VPAGADSVTRSIPALTPDHFYFAVATLQAPRPNVWVTAAVPDSSSKTVTVYLNRPVAHPVAVAVAVFI
jgi:hypothetical protein